MKYFILIVIFCLFFIFNYFEIKGTYSCSTKNFLDVSETQGYRKQKNEGFKFTWHEGLTYYHKISVQNGFLKGNYKVFGNKNSFNSIILFDQPRHLINYYKGNLYYVHLSQIAAQTLHAKCKEDILK